VVLGFVGFVHRSVSDCFRVFEHFVIKFTVFGFARVGEQRARCRGVRLSRIQVHLSCLDAGHLCMS
jgi:hypothetical protein